MNSVLKAWWTLPDTGLSSGSAAPVQQVADFASDIQEICGDTFERHRDLLMQGMTELSIWTPAAMQAGQPQAAREMPPELMASLLEASSKRAEIWADMSRQLGAHYAVLAHQLAQDCGQASAAATTPKNAKTTLASKPEKAS